MKKSILSLIAGNGLAQALQIGALLILARIYKPEDFGVLGETQAIATILVVVITLQLHLTIPLSESKKEAGSRLSKVYAVSLYIFLTLLLPSTFLNHILALSLAIALGIINSLKSYWVYEGNFSKLSFFYIFRALILIISQILLGVLNIENGLLYGAIIGEFISLIYLSIKIFHKGIKLNYHQFVYIKTTLKFIKEKKQFSLYGTLQEFVAVSSFYLPLLLFIKLYGENTGGQYAMASRLVWAPIILLTSSLAQVYYHQFSQKNKWEIMGKWVWFDLKYMLAILCVPVIYYYLSDTVTIIFGDEWKIAQEMIFYLLLAGIFFIYALPFRVAFRAMEKIKTLLIIDSIILCFICSLFLFPLGILKTVSYLSIISFFQAVITTTLSKKCYNSINNENECNNQQGV